MTTKRCAGPCGQVLSHEAFAPDQHRKDGRHTYCRPCRTLLERRRRKLRALGRSPWVDAAPTRAHVHRLLDAGMTRHLIAELAGLNRTSIRNLMVGQPPRQGPAKRLHRKTAAALMAVTIASGRPAPVPVGKTRRAGATVDATGTRRRLQALMAIGWPARELAAQLGAGNQLQIARAQRVTSSTAAAVRALYDELNGAAGPQPKAATYYRGRGYLPPAWWDDDTIDDPRVEPDGIREYDARGRLLVDHSAHRDDSVAWLADRGHDSAAIAALLGATTKTVRRSLARNGDPTVARSA